MGCKSTFTGVGGRGSSPHFLWHSGGLGILGHRGVNIRTEVQEFTTIPRDIDMFELGSGCGRLAATFARDGLCAAEFDKNTRVSTENLCELMGFSTVPKCVFNIILFGHIYVLCGYEFDIYY